ncbi:MAG: sialidase family protein, partial [Thermoguttaceae bacterium]
WTAPGDHAKGVCLGIIRSRDAGNTWSEPVTLFEEPDYDLYHASLVRMPGGEFGLSYTKRRSDKAFLQPCEKVFRYSADEGRTWSDEILISDGEWAWYQTSANDRLLLLENGRLLHPVSRLLTRGKGENEGGCGTIVYRSDDRGRTWQRATPEPVREPERDVFHEAALVEYAPGKVLMLGRTRTGWFWESRSEDGGQTWSEAARSPVRSSVAPPWLVRIPGTQTIGLAWCPYVGPGPMLGPRPVLGWQLSDDGGRTWYGYRELEQGPTREGHWTGYCYGSGEWVGDTLHFAYMDHGGSSPLMRPRYQQLAREWLVGDRP